MVFIRIRGRESLSLKFIKKMIWYYYIVLATKKDCIKYWYNFIYYKYITYYYTHG